MLASGTLHGACLSVAQVRLMSVARLRPVRSLVVTTLRSVDLARHPPVADKEEPRSCFVADPAIVSSLILFDQPPIRWRFRS